MKDVIKPIPEIEQEILDDNIDMEEEVQNYNI